MPTSSSVQLLLAHLGLALTYPLFLAWSRGPILGVGVLLLGGLLSLTTLQNTHFLRQQRILIILLISCTSLWSIINFLHNEPTSSYDLISRYALTVPILILFMYNRPTLKWFFTSCASGACVALLVACWQLDSTSYERAQGFTGVIQFGDLSLMMGIFSLTGWLYKKPECGSCQRWIYLLAGLAGLYASFLSGSRGGWIAIPFIALVVGVSYSNKLNTKRVVLSIAALSAISVVLIINSNSIHDRVNRAAWELNEYKNGNPDTSIGNRLALWLEASTIIKEHLSIGLPTKDFKNKREVIADNNPKLKNAMSLPNTHNSFLEILVTYGVIGLLPFLILITYTLSGFLKYLRSENIELRLSALCGANLVIGYIIFSQSQVMFQRNNTLIFFLISLAYLWGQLYPLKKTTT